jgi:hypothetical protein
MYGRSAIRLVDLGQQSVFAPSSSVIYVLLSLGSAIGTPIESGRLSLNTLRTAALGRRNLLRGPSLLRSNTLSWSRPTRKNVSAASAPDGAAQRGAQVANAQLRALDQPMSTGE